VSKVEHVCHRRVADMLPMERQEWHSLDLMQVRSYVNRGSFDDISIISP